VAGITPVIFSHAQDFPDQPRISVSANQPGNLAVSRHPSLRDFFHNGKNFINQIRVQAVPHFISFFLVNFICSVFIQCSLPNPIHCVCLCLRQQSRHLSAKCFPVHFHCIAALSVKIHSRCESHHVCILSSFAVHLF